MFEAALGFLLVPNGIFAILMGVIIGATVWARKNGKDDARAEQAASEAKARDIADQVENDVGALTPAQKRENLKKWSKS